MPTSAREALLVALSPEDAERALDDILAERGFEKAVLPPPTTEAPVARSDTRFFDVDLVEPSLSIIREWTGYSDATPWGTALELAEGLPPAARMEMALPPALSVLARALSRRTTVQGIASRDKPWHLVGVVFREGRAIDVITAVKDRVVVGPQGKPRASAPHEAKTHLTEWLAPYGVGPSAVEIVLGVDDLPSAWRLTYLHA